MKEIVKASARLSPEDSAELFIVCGWCSGGPVHDCKVQFSLDANGANQQCSPMCCGAGLQS